MRVIEQPGDASEPLTSTTAAKKSAAAAGTLSLTSCSPWRFSQRGIVDTASGSVARNSICAWQSASMVCTRACGVRIMAAVVSQQSEVSGANAAAKRWSG